MPPQSAFDAGAMIFCSPAHAHLFRFGAQQATGTPSRDERMAACCAIRIQARVDFRLLQQYRPESEILLSYGISP
jgi:hypothetical protein